MSLMEITNLYRHSMEYLRKREESSKENVMVISHSIRFLHVIIYYKTLYIVIRAELYLKNGYLVSKCFINITR